MDAWLSSVRDAVAAEAGLDASELELSAGEEETVLDLARIAAHESGERTNAPLLCYLVGLARRGSVDLERLAAAARRVS